MHNLHGDTRIDWPRLVSLPGFERWTIAVRHGEIARAFGFACFIDRENVRVIEPSQSLCLAVEPIAGIRICQKTAARKFDRDVALQDRVQGQIHDAEPARTKLVKYFEFSQTMDFPDRSRKFI